MPGMFVRLLLLTGAMLSGEWSLTPLFAQEPTPETAKKADAPAEDAEKPKADAKDEKPDAAKPEAKPGEAADHDHAGQDKHAKGDHHADKDHADGHHGDHGPKLGTLLPEWSVAPFAALLLCIAVCPLLFHHWWEHNSNKGIIAAALGIPTAMYLISFGEAGLLGLEHAGKEYISFVLLLGSLFVISGGIYVRGSMKATPLTNAMILALGGSIASLIGTTGASMLLIRPLLRANQHRSKLAHIVVFFIFIVSNCGGLLTPLGDPPLFLGFLRGVPFTWTLKLLPQFLFVNILLLVVFFIYDSIMAKKDPGPTSPQPDATSQPESFGVEGIHNFLFLAAIVVIIYMAGMKDHTGENLWVWGVQEVLMLAVAAASFLMTSSAIRGKNRFSFTPINEVAILFAGIFVTMIPALAILNVKGDQLGVNTPAQFFWATGILSSFLDNAPTYLTFAATACGIHHVNDQGAYLAEFLKLGPKAEEILAAISCGAVLMGANTYIGNGPNFMVKAIAEENNVEMPSFFGYMLYSVSILIPTFILVTFVFFR